MNTIKAATMVKGEYCSFLKLDLTNGAHADVSLGHSTGSITIYNITDADLEILKTEIERFLNNQ